MHVLETNFDAPHYVRFVRPSIFGSIVCEDSSHNSLPLCLCFFVLHLYAVQIHGPQELYNRIITLCPSRYAELTTKDPSEIFDDLRDRTDRRC